ncbi:hypothetical protein [Roseococcus suduntuyensis]|uniref:Uncharacterized protein n=1 Tax=Roseococcus suduntuyensis TaxID=455361 RepID=A0A840AHP3_9PROT|nr:hypothetical protein [Roseococcus suduntuyensis]MBB3900103.1 hypothetical protein [Roseococcus suduntuyensis]
MSKPSTSTPPALLAAADDALSILNAADDRHLGDLESFAELLAHLVEKPDDTLTTSALAATAMSIHRHADGVAEALRSAVDLLREAVMQARTANHPK